MNSVRQGSPHVAGINPDHLKRYYFAANRVSMGMRVLDAACGIGYGSQILWHVWGDVDAADLSMDAIAQARCYYPGPRYVRLDLEKAPDLPYDLTVSLETIEHLKHPELFLNKIAGPLIASVPNEERYPFNPETFKDDEYPHQRHYTPEQFDALLVSCGFRVTERWCQKDGNSGVIVPGTDGMFLIYVCERS